MNQELSHMLTRLDDMTHFVAHATHLLCHVNHLSNKEGDPISSDELHTIDTLLTELQGSCDALEWESVDDSIARMRRAAELQYEAQRIKAVKLLMEPVLLDKLGEPGLVRRIVEAF